jgi:cobalt/nickel transport system permease protein
MLASGACAFQLAISGTTPLSVTLPAMLGVHAIIGVGEAFITVVVVGVVLAVRPDLVRTYDYEVPMPRLEGAGVSR